MSRQNLAILVLFIVSLASWRYFQSSDIEVFSPSSTDPEFTATKLKSVNYNPLGEIDYKIYAGKMVHFKERLVTKFEKPVLLVYRNQGKTIWQVTGKQGTLFDKDIFKLKNAVTITNLTNDQTIRLIKTEYLELDLNKNEISNNEFVEMFGPQLTQQGIGLFGQLDTEEISILSEIKATYLNEQNK